MKKDCEGILLKFMSSGFARVIANHPKGIDSLAYVESDAKRLVDFGLFIEETDHLYEAIVPTDNATEASYTYWRNFE